MKMEFIHRNTPGGFPITLKIITWSIDEQVDEKDIEIHSSQELDTLLLEIDQFNHDPSNDGMGLYKTIVNN